MSLLPAQDKKAGKIITDYFTWLDAGKVDVLMTLLTDDFSAITPMAPTPFNKTAWKGMGLGFNTAFPDMKHEINYWFADDNRVAVRGNVKGTNTGSMMGNPPTGNKINLPYISLFELNGKGKIKSITSQFDLKLMETQLLAGLPDPKKIAEKTVRDLFVAMDAGQTDQFQKYTTKDFSISNPFLPEPSPIQAFQGILTAQKTGFPDIRHEIVEIISDGKYVTTKGIFYGTNTGSMMGNPPTGNKVKLPFLVLDEMDGQGKIKNRFVQFDSKSLETQLMAGINTSLRNENVIRELLSASDLGDAEKFMSLWANKSTSYFAGVETSKADMIKGILGFKIAFPDIKRNIDEISVSGNNVTVRGHVTGTNKGKFMGQPATNAKINVPWLGYYHLNDSGKILKGWVEFDTNALNTQLKANKKTYKK